MTTVAKDDAKDDASGAPEGADARLVDIVVEEVSLVDQAANNRQFLVIKRARSGMSKTNEQKTDAATPETDVLGALERVGKAVAELADEIDEPSEVARLVAIAEQLDELVRAILEADAEEETAEEQDAGSGANADDASKNAPAATPPAAPLAQPGERARTKDAAFAKLEEMLTALRATVKARTPPTPAAPAAPSGPASASAPPAAAAPVASSAPDPLAKVLAAISGLGAEIKAQGQRLGRLEKGVGLPSSQPTSEGPRRAVEEVSWPLDLNEPVSREVVDKRVSFHD